MSRRAASAFFVLSFSLIPWALEACGRAANVLEGQNGPPDSGEYGYGGEPAGGAGVTSIGGEGSSGGPAGGAESFVPPKGGTSGAGGSPFAGGGPSTTEEGGFVDTGPNSGLLHLLAGELCQLPARYPCLALNVRGAHPGATANELRLLCTDNTRASQRAIFGDRCWAEWRAYAQCSLSRTDYCPCELDGGSFCVFTPEDHDFGLSIPAAPGSVSCEAGAAAVARCAIATGGAGTEKGPGGAYDWVDGEFGCSVRGAAKGGVDWIESSCVGSVGGLQQCTCRVNGVDLVDHVGVLTGENPEILAADCRAVALALAAGRCADVLDCCYQYTQGQDQLCSCSAHPEHAGFASCKDLAASLNGSVYGVCDAYRPPPRP